MRNQLNILLFVLLLSAIPKVVRASQDFLECPIYDTSILVFCDNHVIPKDKAYSLWFYLKILEEQSSLNMLPVKVYFTNMYPFANPQLSLHSPTYTIGIAQTLFPAKIAAHSVQESAKKAIILHCNTAYPNLQEIVKLIYYTQTHQEEVLDKQMISFNIPSLSYSSNFKRKKNVSFSSLPFSVDFTRSISPKDVDNIMSLKTSDVIEKLLHKKIYAHWFLSSGFNAGRLEFFIQNDRFKFFICEDNHENRYPKTLESIMKLLRQDSYQHSLFGLENACNSSTCDSVRFIIGASDSTFYYYDNEKNVVKGPFVLPMIYPIRYSNCSFELKSSIGEDTLKIYVFEQGYEVFFNTKNYTLTIDSSSFNSVVIDFLKNKESKLLSTLEEKRIYKEKQTERYWVQLALFLLVILNVFLATSKKL